MNTEPLQPHTGFNSLCPSSDEDVPEPMDDTTHGRLFSQNAQTTALVAEGIGTFDPNIPHRTDSLNTPTDESSHCTGLPSILVCTPPYISPAIRNIYGTGNGTSQNEEATFIKKYEHDMALDRLKGISHELIVEELLLIIRPYLEKHPCFVTEIVEISSTSKIGNHYVDIHSNDDVKRIFLVYVSSYGIRNLIDKWIERIHTKEGCNLIGLIITRLGCSC